MASGQDIVKKAKSYEGKGPSTFVNAYGMPVGTPWCCIFVWFVFQQCGAGKSFAKNASVQAAYDWLRSNGGKQIGNSRSVGDARPGDLAFFGSNGHIAIVEKKINNTTCSTINGNYGYNDATSTVRTVNRSTTDTGQKPITSIWRPPNLSGSSSSSKVSRAALIALYGNEAKAYFALRDLKWTHKGTCAVMGNMAQESGFSTTAISFDGYGSIGLCQWTGGRRTALENWCRSHSLSVKEVAAQCKYLDYETKGGYGALYKDLTTNTSISLEDLTKKFCKEWERPAEWAANYPNRIKHAKLYFDRYSGAEDGGGGAIDFNKTVEKLISSDNFKYVSTQDKPKYESNFVKTFKLGMEKFNVNTTTEHKSLTKLLSDTFNLLKQVIEEFVSVPPEFKSDSSSLGSVLPIYTTIVEAPFGELELGGVKFGTAGVASNYSSYPNYIQSISINKTNGTINDYTVTLIHQVAPGDNPNYIANLLTNTGYNEITISYGDAASGQYFQDVKALVSGVQTSFDFASSLITYRIHATSLAYVAANVRMNFPATVDKPSNVILDLIRDENGIVTKYFTGMKNITQVTSSGLIPTNDAVVTIDERANSTILDYLTYLTSLMRNKNKSLADVSSYYLVVNDEANAGEGNTFSIKEVNSQNPVINALTYEVDVGYPDANMVFDFNINTNYAWAAAYNKSLGIQTYNYNIDNQGNVISRPGSSVISSTIPDSLYNIDENTWKQLTRFPITATLTTKQLIAPMLLLSYIKVNNYYFGNRRITSGLYIVTEQQDIISGSGCRTSLGLTRVASDLENLSTDGRVLT